jgi:hypothetical protein
MEPSSLVHTILGIGVPRDWQTISVPVVLEKSTWFGGSWMKTGPEVSAWPRAEDNREIIMFLVTENFSLSEELTSVGSCQDDQSELHESHHETTLAREKTSQQQHLNA